MIDQYLIKFEKVQDETEASTLTLKQREISHSLMNKRIRKYVLKEKIERISNDLKNNYKMNIYSLRINLPWSEHGVKFGRTESFNLHLRRKPPPKRGLHSQSRYLDTLFCDS